MEKNRGRIDAVNNCGTLPYLPDKRQFEIYGMKVNPINEATLLEIRKEALNRYNAYSDEWEKAYFDLYSGGFNVYHKDHKFTETGGGGNAEVTVGKMLAKYNGKQVEFLPEGWKKQPDVRFDGKTWDIKYIDNANEETIRSAIRDARKADNAIFYYTDESKYLLLVSAIEREAGRFLKGQTNKMPGIYEIDKNGFLKLLWEKQKGN
jgi:transposase-like protein